MTLRWPLTPHMLISDVRLYPRISVSNFHGNTSKYMDAVTMFQKLTQKVHDPKMTFDPTSVEVIMCDSIQGSFYQSPMKICPNMWIQWSLFSKNVNQRLLTPRWPLTPSLLRSHVWLYPRVIVSQVPWKIHQSKWIQYPLFKNLNQRSLTPRWPLTPHLFRWHVWRYPRIIVSKSHGDTSMYVDTVINFVKNTMYYILHILRTYILPTTYRMSDHIVSFWTRI